MINGGLFICPVTCGQEGCQRTFHHTWSLKRHLKSQHIELEDVDGACMGVNPQVDQPDNEMNQPDLFDGENEVDEGDDDAETQEWKDFTSDEMEARALGLVCSMVASTSVVQSSVDLVVEHVSDMFSDLVGFVKNRTSNVTAQLGIDPESEILKEFLAEMETFKDPFANA